MNPTKRAIPTALIILMISAAWPAMADIRLVRPWGGEVLVSGETVTVEWDTVSGDDPAYDWVEVFYNWVPDGGQHVVTLVTDPADVYAGTFSWVVPTVSEYSYLNVEVCGSTDGESCISRDVSNSIIVIPSTATPSIFLSDPRPTAPYQLEIQGGSTYVIRWEVTGCNASTQNVPMDISFSSSAMPSFEVQGTALPCQESSFVWNVPDLETTSGHIRLNWMDPVRSGNIFPFTVTADPDPNHAPVADAGADQWVSERSGVILDGTGSSDEDGDTLTYLWERIDTWIHYDFDLFDVHSAEATFEAPSIDVPEITFVFRLTVTDPDGEVSSDIVNVTVTAGGPVLDTVIPLEGWYLTPVELSGADLRGCGVYMDDERVGTVPDHPADDAGYTLVLPDLATGSYQVRVECEGIGNATYPHEFEVLRVPYQWDWGFKFHNQSGYTMSWQDLVNAFGYDATHILLCCDWDGIFCPRACHDPLMQLVYDYYVRDIGMGGSCWGMSAASVKYAMGELSLAPGDNLRDHNWQIEPVELSMTTRIKAEHIRQVSAEVIGFLLDHVGDDLFDIVEQIQADGLSGEQGVISINNMVSGTSPLNLSGHAVVADQVVEISEDEYRIYVYDPNVEEFSVCRDEVDFDEYERITNLEEYPYIRVYRRESGTEAWEFEMADGSMWGGDDRWEISTSFGDIPYYGLTYYPQGLIANARTAPLSGRGILMILGSDADAGIQDQDGKLLGVDPSGELKMEIPGAIPVMPVADVGDPVNETFVLPEGNYTTTIYGREHGTYDIHAIVNNRLFAVIDAGMDTTTEDSFEIKPESGQLIFSTSDSDKPYSARIIERVVQGEDSFQRSFEVLDGTLSRDENVKVSTDEEHDALFIANDSARAMTFNLRIGQAQLGPQPEPPDLPAMEDHVLEVNAVEVPAGKTVRVVPSNWGNLGQATASLTVEDGTDPNPEATDSGCGCTTHDRGAGLPAFFALLLLGLVIRRRR